MDLSSSIGEAISKTKSVLSGASSAREVRTDLLKVHGNVLEFKNKFYQISNMSAVEVVAVTRLFPGWALVGLFLGGLALLVGIGLPSVGIIAAAVCCTAVCAYALIRHGLEPTDYGLLLLLNAGHESSSVIVSPHREFLEEVARRISELMSNRFAGEIVFNIQNQEIQMHGVSGSVVNTGSVDGGIVNSLRTGTEA